MCKCPQQYWFGVLVLFVGFLLVKLLWFVCKYRFVLFGFGSNIVSFAAPMSWWWFEAFVLVTGLSHSDGFAISPALLVLFVELQIKIGYQSRG